MTPRVPRTAIPLATIAGLWSKAFADASRVTRPTKLTTPGKLAEKHGLSCDDPALLLLVAVLCGNIIMRSVRPYYPEEVAWIQCEGEVILAFGLVRYPLLSTVVTVHETDEWIVPFKDEPIVGIASLCRDRRSDLRSIIFVRER